MDWLNDKKNQPYVIGVLAVIILGAVVYFTMFAGGSGGGGDYAPPPAATAPQTSPPAPMNAPDAGMQPPPEMGGAPGPEMGGAPGPDMGGAPGPDMAAPPGAQGQQVAQGEDGLKPMEPWRKDPFLPLGYKKPSKKDKEKLKPHLRDLPPIQPGVDVPKVVYPWTVEKKASPIAPERPQPARRLAGILLGDRVSAIIESNGKYERIWPGKMLSDQLAVVEKIERDRVVLKTVDEKPRYIEVRMAAAPRSESTTDTGNMSDGPPGSMSGQQ